MSTRCITIVKEDGKDLLTFYRHSDGYPTSHGADLKEFLEKHVLVNGIGSGLAKKKQANGIGCLAASLIKELKQGPGGIYIVPNGTKGMDEEYLYIISNKEKQFLLKIYDTSKEEKPVVIYTGTVEGFNPKEVEERK